MRDDNAIYRPVGSVNLIRITRRVGEIGKLSPDCRRARLATASEQRASESGLERRGADFAVDVRSVAERLLRTVEREPRR